MRLEPKAGFEPATWRLQIACATIAPLRPGHPLRPDTGQKKFAPSERPLKSIGTRLCKVKKSFTCPPFVSQPASAGRKEHSVKGNLLAVIAFLALAALAFAACGGDEEEAGDSAASSAGSGDTTVEVGDFFFEPAALSADSEKALTLKVTNNGAAEHTFTIDDLGIDEEIAAGEEKEISLESSAAGQFEFYCRYHSSKMTGTITIGEGSAAAPTKDGDSGSGSGYGY